MTDVHKGKDPVAEADARKQALTLEDLFNARKASDTARSARTLSDYEKALKLDIFPAIGHVPANELTAEQISRELDKIEKRSKHAAHKARSAIGSTYRWAYRKRKVSHIPTIGLGYTVQSIARDRVLSDAELAKLWHGIEAGDGLTERMQIILKLAILTAQREKEVAGARLDELRLDGDRPVWKIKGTHSRKGRKVEGRMKTKREQIVPLTPQAVSLFREALALSAGGEYLFPADLSRTKIGKTPRTPHINPESVSRAMARLREKIGLEDARVHDLQKCVTTWLRENRVSLDVCDLILHHKLRGVTATHYDWSTGEELVRPAMQMWSNHVWRVIGQEQPASNVVHFDARAG